MKIELSARIVSLSGQSPYGVVELGRDLKGRADGTTNGQLRMSAANLRALGMHMGEKVRITIESTEDLDA